MFDAWCQTVPELLIWRARQSAQAVACHERTSTGAWQAYTWQELAHQVALTAAGLASLGLKPQRAPQSQAVVAVLGRTCYTWWVIELATYHCGGVLAGLDPRLPHDQALALLDRIRPALVLTDDEHLACRLEARHACERSTPRWLPHTAGRPWFALRLAHAVHKQGGPLSAGRGLRQPEIELGGACSPADEPPRPRKTIEAAAATPAAAPVAHDAPSASQVDTAGDGCDTESEPLVPAPRPAPHSPATLLFTSGTSGPPKCLLYRQEQLLLACRSICQAFPELGPSDSTLCWLPLAHLFQRVMNLVAIAVGGSIYFEPEPAQIMRSLREAEPTIFIGVPKFYERLHAGFEERLARATWWQRRLVRWALLRHAGRFRRPARRKPGGMVDRWLDRHLLAPVREAMGRRLRFAITGSAPMPLWLLEFFEQVGILVLEAYGISENTVPLAANRPGAFCFGSVGKPLPGNDVRISAEGEVQVRGGGVCGGYLSGPGAEGMPSPPPFTPDGYFRTGDCGRMDEHGYLYLQGRLNELVKISSGCWLSPTRIEQRYLSSPYLEQVVVFADGRQPPVALIYPSQAAREQLQHAEAQDQAAASERLRALVQAELTRLDPDLPPHERIARFALLERPLSVAAGELTLLFKPRRAEIARRHAGLLAELGYVSTGLEAGTTASH